MSWLDSQGYNWVLCTPEEIQENSLNSESLRVLVFSSPLFTFQNILESISYINHDSKLASYNLALQSFIAELLMAYSWRNKFSHGLPISNVNCDN